MIVEYREKNGTFGYGPHPKWSNAFDLAQISPIILTMQYGPHPKWSNAFDSYIRMRNDVKRLNAGKSEPPTLSQSTGFQGYPRRL